jgi:hypothetical protein
MMPDSFFGQKKNIRLSVDTSVIKKNCPKLAITQWSENSPTLIGSQKSTICYF